MREQSELSRSRPGTFQIDILKMVFDQLADACCTVDVRQYLEQEVGRREGGFDCDEVSLLVLVAHGADGNPQRTIVERADQRVDFRLEGGLGELLGKAPELATARDRGMVIKKHAMG